ncbi:protein kinase [Myxococcaceae bacterium GXIMD 01537]
MAVPFGKYELLRKIASGGMGQVFLAREHGAGFERLAVLKLILPHLAEDDEFLTMFLEEARLVARLSHPNLITILDLTEIDGRHCLAMEYVQGDDIRRIEKQARTQGKVLPVGLVLRIIADAAAGLDYAHKARDSQGQPLHLVHRDVSPQNVLVGFDGGVKVIDFGVAKAATSSQQTATGILKGKYPYMSPEQASGLGMDHRSDQFALGVVLWEMLTGKRLFKGDSDLMTLRLVKDCQVPPPSQLNPKLPPGLDEVVLKALAPTPEERYTDCGALRLALEDYLIQMRMPASNAHLSAFLRELYAERIAAEADPTRLDQLAEDADLDSRSSPSSRSNVKSIPSRGASPAGRSAAGAPGQRSRVGTVGGVPPPQVREPARGTLQLEAVPSSRRFPVVPVAVGVGAVLLLAAAALVFLRKPVEPVAPPVKPQVVDVAPERPVEPVKPPPAQPEAPKKVQVYLYSEPSGAAVTVDMQPAGMTPMPLELEPGAPAKSVVFALADHKLETRAVSAADAPQVVVALAPQPKPPPTRPQGGKKPPSPLGIKSGR